MTATFECRGLSKRFGATQALEDVNISIASVELEEVK